MVNIKAEIKLLIIFDVLFTVELIVTSLKAPMAI